MTTELHVRHEGGCPPASQGASTVKLDRGGETRPGIFPQPVSSIAGDAPTRRAHGKYERCPKPSGEHPENRISTGVCYGDRPISAARAAPDWLEDRTNALRDLWLADVPSAEIGRRIGVSKNAVIGKARRIGLPSRGSPLAVAHAKARRLAYEAARANAQEPNGCRYIIGDPKEPDWHYCHKPQGKRRDGTQSDYCQEHHDLCHVTNVVTEAEAA